MRYLAGIDIGGTKCAVTIGKENGKDMEILYKEKFSGIPPTICPAKIVSIAGGICATYSKRK